MYSLMDEYIVWFTEKHFDVGKGHSSLYYQGLDCWHLGLMIKSPQWMESFQYNTEDELGLPVRQTVDLDLPMVISLGTAWGVLKNDCANRVDGLL